jgi:putative oxygen-independent coproporphyrinogen III oxidase
MSLSLPPLALYVHLPWCVRKCPYCDFNSHEFRGTSGRAGSDRDASGRAEPPFAAYIDALVADLEHDLPLVWGRTVHSIFFGGGTPSLFPPEQIDRFLQAANARLRIAPGCEITLETNPGTAEHGRFEDYRKAGVNRISFGVQSFDDGCLQRLGRIHDSGQAEAAIKLAQDAGFDNLNLDLMYALPEQTLAMAERDLERALQLAPAHISHYQLTLEANTLFAARPPAGIPDEDLAWDMQEACQSMLDAAGYAQYEISAYAQPGRQCAHNLNYWRFGDYLGIGAGAHGKLTLPAGRELLDADRDASAGSQTSARVDDGRILRRSKTKHPAGYIAAAGGSAVIGEDRDIPLEHRPFEFMLNALRLVEGFGMVQFEARTGLSRDAIAVPLAEAQRRGWLIDQAEAGDPAGRIRPTETGLRFANDIIGLFLENTFLENTFLENTLLERTPLKIMPPESMPPESMPPESMPPESAASVNTSLEGKPLEQP